MALFPPRERVKAPPTPNSKVLRKKGKKPGKYFYCIAKSDC